jgi:hypothetical protein
VKLAQLDDLQPDFFKKLLHFGRGKDLLVAEEMG